MTGPSKAIRTKSGEIIKAVICENCGHHYEYKLQRVGVGNFRILNCTRAEAEQEAALIAAEDLKKMLENDCDVVPCPECGAITREMKKVRMAFYTKTLAGIGGGIGVLLLVYVAWLITGRVYIVPLVVGAGIASFAIAILIAGSRKKVRR